VRERLRVCALYPDLMNIYADRGNLLLLERRCRWRGIEFSASSSGLGEPLDPDGADLYYIGGGQDRDQKLCAEDLAHAKRDAIHAAAARGAVILAVCGGYQLLGRYYRDVAGEEQPGIGLLPLHTIADKRRMIGDVLLDCGWAGRTLAGFENHAGRTILDEGADPLGRVVSGFGNDGESGYEGARYKRAYATYLHGPLLPRNPWFADHLLSEALAHAGGPTELTPLPDELEQEAHAVSAARARARGGKF
jgi:CobQ-like glutamine amidotransferase family enzyme